MEEYLKGLPTVDNSDNDLLDNFGLTIEHINFLLRAYVENRNVWDYFILTESELEDLGGVSPKWNYYRLEDIRADYEILVSDFLQYYILPLFIKVNGVSEKDTLSTYGVIAEWLIENSFVAINEAFMEEIDVEAMINDFIENGCYADIPLEEIHLSDLYIRYKKLNTERFTEK